MKISNRSIQKATKLILGGELVALPTETVYGLGADATNSSACQKIFTTKNRPAINPLIVHVASVAEAENIALFNSDAKKLSNLWPGPLTLVLPLKSDTIIAPEVTAGLKTIAIRIPNHPLTLALLEETKRPIAAPSANISGKLSSTSAQQVRDYFGNSVYTLGEEEYHCAVGLESTILDLSTEQPIILRQGIFTAEVIRQALDKEVLLSKPESKIKAPGMLLKHYAPKTKIRLNAQELGQGELGLNFYNSQLNSEFSLNLSRSGDLKEAASNLYRFLYQLDEHAQTYGYKTIAVAPIPDLSIGMAINDRLKRAENS